MLKTTPLSFLISLLLIFSCLVSVQANEISPLTNNTYTLNSFDFKVSPNPAENVIRVKFDTNITSDLFIYDGVGNKVLSETINNESSKEISLHDLKSGIYFVSVKVNDKTVIKRLIKY